MALRPSEASVQADISLFLAVSGPVPSSELPLVHLGHELQLVDEALHRGRHFRHLRGGRLEATRRYDSLLKMIKKSHEKTYLEAVQHLFLKENTI